ARAGGPLSGGVVVLRHQQRTGRRPWVVKRVRLHPSREGRSVLRAEAPHEERGSLPVPLDLRLQPEPESRRVVETLLTTESRGPILSRSVLVRQAIQLCLATVPARGLIAAPGRGDRDDR